MIPVYCMEEHNEAFYYWGAAVEKGYLGREGNTLFHVDHHDDLESGGYFHDFTQPFQNLEERKRFTYEKLGIADFIVPALYEGIFSKLYNMKALLPKKFESRERFVKRIGSNALMLGEYVPFLHGVYRREKREEYRFFTYYEGSLSDTLELENTVLDIDLDYFCWDDSLKSVPPKRIEITKEAYEEYQENPYHPFRILPRRLLKTEESGGHFYIRYEEPPIQEKEADETRIRKRVDRFMEWLRTVSWQPCLITLCCSAHSGYLPAEYAGLVEELVREGLESIYQLTYQNNGIRKITGG